MKTFNLLLTYFLTQLYPVAPAEDELGGTGEWEKSLDVPIRGLYGTPHLVVQLQHFPLG